MRDSDAIDVYGPRRPGPNRDLTDAESLRLLGLAEAGSSAAAMTLGGFLGGLELPTHMLVEAAGDAAPACPDWVRDNWAAAGWDCGVAADFGQTLYAHIPELRPTGAAACLSCWHLFGRPCLALALADRHGGRLPPRYRGNGLRYLRNVVGGVELGSGSASDRLWVEVLVPRAADLGRAHALGGVSFDPYRDQPLAGILAALDEVWDQAVARGVSRVLAAHNNSSRGGGPTAAITDRVVREVAAGLGCHPDAWDAAGHAALGDRLTDLPARRPLAGVLPRPLAELLRRGLPNTPPRELAAQEWGPACTDTGGLQPAALALVRHLVAVLGRSCMTQWGSVRLTTAAAFAADPDGPDAVIRPVRDCLVVETALDAADLDVGLRALVAAVNKTGGFGGGGCTSVITGADTATWGDGRIRGWLIPVGRDA